MPHSRPQSVESESQPHTREDKAYQLDTGGGDLPHRGLKEWQDFRDHQRGWVSGAFLQPHLRSKVRYQTKNKKLDYYNGTVKLIKYIDKFEEVVVKTI